jgi:hypothetical protein
MNNKVVYLHRKSTDNSVFYVGIGNLSRAYSKQRSKWWSRVVDKYGYTVEIFKDGLTLDEACNLEIELIKEYGRRDLKNGQLVNQTDGGITTKGLSEKCLMKKVKSLKSVVKTEEWRKKISLSLKGKPKSKHCIEKISNSLKGKKHSESTKEKMRLSNKSKIISAKPILCYDYNTSDFIGRFCSQREAAIALGCLQTSIANNLSRKSQKVNSKILNKQLKFDYVC